MTSIKIRPYREADLTSLWKLDQMCFLPGISYDKRELKYFIAEPGSVTLVAEKDSRPVGFAVAHIEAGSERPPVGRIITIDILPAERSQGLGEVLMKKVEESLLRRNCSSVLLEVAVDNDRAIAFYKRLGYESCGLIKNYYLDSIDALVLKKALKKVLKSVGKKL